MIRCLLSVVVASVLFLPALADEKDKAKGISGTVTAVSAEKKTITLAAKKTDKDKPEKDVTYNLADDVKVTADGKEAKMSDVKVGSSVTLTLSDDKKVSAIDVARKDTPKDK